MKGGPRKLLVAAVGVATINYVGCGKSTTPNDTTAKDADIIVTSGNLPTAEPYVPDAAPVPTAEPTTPTATDAGKPRHDGGAPPTSGNLPAPIPTPAPTPKKK